MKYKWHAAAERIKKCIETSTTIEHLDCCDRMINNLRGLLCAGDLAKEVLLKRIEFIAQPYPVTE